MTVSHAQEFLLGWFLEHDTFDPQVDYQNVVDPKSLTPDVDRALVRAALDALTTAGVLVVIKVGEADFTQWALTKPLHLHSQNVELSFPVAKGIADTINDYNRAISNDPNSLSVESHQINANHVAGLISIIQQLSQALADKSKPRR